MTKYELIGEMANELSLSRKKCGETLNLMIEEIVSALEKGRRFIQPGFGSFKTVDVNERTRRNPLTGKLMLCPKKRRLKFRTSDILKEEINE